MSFPTQAEAAAMTRAAVARATQTEAEAAAVRLHADCDHASAYGPARGAGVYCAVKATTAAAV